MSKESRGSNSSDIKEGWYVCELTSFKHVLKKILLSGIFIEAPNTFYIH